MSTSTKTAGDPVAASSSVEQPGTAAEPTADRLRAAGSLFEEIATGLVSAGELVHESIQAPDSVCLLVALAALLEKLGATADRASRACGAGAGVQDDDLWLLSPRGAEGMRVLEGGRHE